VGDLCFWLNNTTQLILKLFKSAPSTIGIFIVN